MYMQPLTFLIYKQNKTKIPQKSRNEQALKYLSTESKIVFGQNRFAPLLGRKGNLSVR